MNLKVKRTRRCSKCGEVFTLNCFHKDRRKKLGRSKWCKWCKNKNSVKWDKANPEKVYERVRRWMKANPEKVNEIHKRWKKANPEKVYEIRKRYNEANPQKKNARAYLYWAIKKAKIKRGICEVCGEEKVDGHHEDYNKPLEVNWLCRKHHKGIHRAN